MNLTLLDGLGADATHFGGIEGWGLGMVVVDGEKGKCLGVERAEMRLRKKRSGKMKFGGAG